MIYIAANLTETEYALRELLNQSGESYVRVVHWTEGTGAIGLCLLENYTIDESDYSVVKITSGNLLHNAERILNYIY